LADLVARAGMPQRKGARLAGRRNYLSHAWLAAVIWLVAAAGGCGLNDAGDNGGIEEHGGEAGFREFLDVLQAAVGDGDVDFLVERALTVEVVCGEDDVPPQTGGPECVEVGERFAGLPISRWRSEGGIRRIHDVRDDLAAIVARSVPAARDDFGGGGLTVYASNVSTDRFDAILTAITTGVAGSPEGSLRRVALGTRWIFDGSRWRLAGLLFAYGLAEDLLRPTDVGLMYYPHWDRFDPEQP